VFKIAFRNVLRNGRRSLMTALSIIVGACALVLLGEYNNLVSVGLQTNLVRSLGHLGVFQKGYFEYGSGKPATYSIADYDRKIALIRNDPELKAMVTVVTPRITLGGIAALPLPLTSPQSTSKGDGASALPSGTMASLNTAVARSC